MKCEDYPCCGHTDLDPCEPQWYDAPGAFDTSRPGNEHALCEHEAGICYVDEPDPDDEDDDDSGFSLRYLHWRIRNRIRFHFFNHGLFARDFARRRLFIRRGMRASFLDVEWHNYDRIRYVSVCVASPRHHRFWATHVTLYLSLGRGPQPIADRLLGRIPSRVYRSSMK